jgi:hypothetical protein
LRLQPVAAVDLAHGFLEAGGEADSPSGAAPGKPFDDLDGEVAVDPDEAGVGSLGQLLDGAEAGQAVDMVADRVHRPDLAVKAHLLALLDHVRPPEAAAEDGDRAGAEQAGEVGHPHPPSGRSNSRLMMWRWISEVPS